MILLLQLSYVLAYLLPQSTERIGGTWLGIVIPALLLIISFGVTWLLYKHFSEKV